jgi:addiction module HigA family antidote
VTIAIRPSSGVDGCGYRTDLRFRKTRIFLQKGLDTPLSKRPDGQITLVGQGPERGHAQQRKCIASDATSGENSAPQGLNTMAPVVHPGRLLKREMVARKLSANRLSLDIGVPSGRITDILNGRRAITADTAVRLGRYFGNSAQFWLDLQGQYDIGVVEREKGAEIARRVRPADAA